MNNINHIFTVQMSKVTHLVLHFLFLEEQKNDSFYISLGSSFELPGFGMFMHLKAALHGNSNKQYKSAFWIFVILF